MIASLFAFLWVQIFYVPTVNQTYQSYLKTPLPDTDGGGSCKVTLYEQVSCFQFKSKEPGKYRAIPLDVFEVTAGADEILEEAADYYELLGTTTCSRYNISFHVPLESVAEMNVLREFDKSYAHVDGGFADNSIGNLIKRSSISVDDTTGEVNVPLGMYQTIHLDEPAFDFQKQKHPYHIDQNLLGTEAKPYVDIQLNASYSNCKYVIIPPNTVHDSGNGQLISTRMFKILLNPPTEVGSWGEAASRMGDVGMTSLYGLGIAIFGGLLFMFFGLCLLGRKETNEMGWLLPCGICPQMLCPCDNDDNNEAFNNVNSDHGGGEEHGSGSGSAVEMRKNRFGR